MVVLQRQALAGNAQVESGISLGEHFNSARAISYPAIDPATVGHAIDKGTKSHALDAPAKNKFRAMHAVTGFASVTLSSVAVSIEKPDAPMSRRR